jgi:hypothetical protein
MFPSRIIIDKWLTVSNLSPGRKFAAGEPRIV